jgi:hypothetical protein
MLGHYDFTDENDEDANAAYIVTHSRITLKLNSIDELIFATLRPKTHVEPFTAKVGQCGSGWIYGLPGSGKTFVARRLAEYLIKFRRRGQDVTKMPEEFVCLFPFTDDAKSMEAFFANLSLKVKVVILDNVDPLKIVFRDVVSPRIKGIPSVFFLTITDHPNPGNDWPLLSLSSHDRLESSFLGYLLRRRVLSIETVTLKANDSMIVGVNWLNRIHAQLTDFCNRQQLNVLPTKHFMIKGLPLESSHQFRAWFVDLWNLVLVEELRKELKDKPVTIAEDPVKIIIRTWPWKDHEGGLPQALRPLIPRSNILKNDSGGLDHEDILQKDPLVIIPFGTIFRFTHATSLKTNYIIFRWTCCFAFKRPRRAHP